MRQSHIAVIGAPMDLGAGRRGVDMGPSALRVAGLNQKLAELGYQAEDLGNVSWTSRKARPPVPRDARYLPQIAHTCARLADMVEQRRRSGTGPAGARRRPFRGRWNRRGHVAALSAEAAKSWA